jgi:hypothetical protein
MKNSLSGLASIIYRYSESILHPKFSGNLSNFKHHVAQQVLVVFFSIG